MFKGLTGFKNAVKGGFSVVAEHSSQLKDQVVGDPNTSKDHLKESLKKKVASVVEATDSVISHDNSLQAKDKAAEVVHKVKHYGAFGEDYLGYTDPTKDLRKAVKQKEKAAKKAKKANKKKTGKKEDLFDPQNIEKYKKEIEQRRIEKEAALAKAQDLEEDEDFNPSPSSDQEPDKLKFTLELAQDSPKNEFSSPVATPLRSPLRSPVRTPKEETEDWKLFQSLTSGVDSLILQKKSELEEIKQESFFQRKQNTQQPEEEKGTKKKKWINPESDGFEDFDGIISGDVDDDSSKDVKIEKPETDKSESEETKTKDEEEENKNPVGFVEIPEDEPIDEEAEFDLFNTNFVDALGDLKLAVIPDSPVYDDDPFNTGFADEIVKKDKEVKRKEASRIKFTGISNVADVLTGKAQKVDKDLVELTVKQKRRRANRINLIAEDETDVTARDKIGTFDSDVHSEQRDIFDDLGEEVPVGDLLSSASLHVTITPQQKSDQKQETKKVLLDLAEFDVLPGESQGSSLTSNVAILAGEFSQPLEEEVDDFDAAFDALAKESYTKSKLDQLEKDFEDADVFDTTAVDDILNLVSLANQVNEADSIPLDTFEDKDPFDTSAYDDIAGVLEEELGFESLAKRDPKEDEAAVAEGEPTDVFGGTAAPEPVSDSGWAAFKEEKPARPPPPKPRPEPPRRPPQVQINPSSRPNTPSVVVKAPSTESIKSWNISVAENLINKSVIEALEAEVLAEEEFDPFDTTKFADADEENVVEEVDGVASDPFDTSEVPDYEKEFRLKLQAEEELRQKARIDLLTDGEDLGADIELTPIVPEKGPEPDPFDTGFANKVLPNKGDPFDTSFVSKCPGRAEIHALEEEFIEKEEFDPRTAEGSIIPRKVVAPGTAGRARPKRGIATDLKVKAPVDRPKADEDSVKDALEDTVNDDSLEDDPFDTSIVNKVICVERAISKSDISVEDSDFDPTSTFELTQKEEIDPFDTTIADIALPQQSSQSAPVQEPEPEPEPEVKEEPKEEVQPAASAAPEPKVLELEGKKFKILPPAPPRKSKRTISDEDFDPRA